MLILVADDDPDLVDIIAYALRSDGQRVITAARGDTALDLAVRRRPDMAIIDIMMPGLDGFEVCRRLRKESYMPIILLTARGEESSRVWGLDIGADDYVTKPFSHKELLARVRSLARRTQPAGLRHHHGTLQAGGLRLDQDTQEVHIAATKIDLTPTEYAVLHCLLANAGKVVTHDVLFDWAFGFDSETSPESLRVHVRHLRQKIEADPAAPKHIVSVRGIGYKILAS